MPDRQQSQPLSSNQGTTECSSLYAVITLMIMSCSNFDEVNRGFRVTDVLSAFTFTSNLDKLESADRL